MNEFWKKCFLKCLPLCTNRFSEIFGAFGFSDKAFLPCYGLAEATVAVSFAPLDQGIRTDIVDARQMRATNLAMPASAETKETERRCLVACGRTFEGHEIIICDRNGNLLEERLLIGFQDQACRRMSRWKWLPNCSTGDEGELQYSQRRNVLQKTWSWNPRVKFKH